MPIMSCKKNGKPGKKFGKHGTCYTGKSALKRALAQMKAMILAGWKPGKGEG